MLSEALSFLPYAYILDEPHLGKNYYAVKANDAKLFKEFGIDLYKFSSWRLPFAFFFRRLRPFGFRQDFILHEFKQKLLPQFAKHVAQIGVKEIKHTGWQNYIRHFPEMKVVMLGRDPRDIYISYFKKWKRDNFSWRGPFDPEHVAKFYNREFQMQLIIRDLTDCIEVRYEDLCTDPNILKEIKGFLESPIPGIGKIGAFISSNSKRRNEFLSHGSEITTKSVQKWQNEKDKDLLDHAIAFFSLLPEYSKFWGYEF